MTRPPDRVEMLAGVTHLPVEFREVARLVSRAGIDGFAVANVTIGVDREAFLKEHDARTYITISYQEKPDATEKENR